MVTEKAAEYLMNNPRYGYTNSLQRWTVRISNNGEFIHANPDSASAQGNSNVTHGCVNLSLADAEAYFNSAIWGDPVEVSGTNVSSGSRTATSTSGACAGTVAGEIGALSRPAGRAAGRSGEPTRAGGGRSVRSVPPGELGCAR